MPEEVVFEEAEVEPIIGNAPSAYDGIVVFEESEVEPIIGRPPSSYDGTVVFDESEVEPIIGSASSSYDGAIAFEPDADPSVSPAPSSYDGAIVAPESAGEVFGAPVRRSPYDRTIVLPGSQGEVSIAPLRKSPYDGTVVFEESEVEPIVGRRPTTYDRVIRKQIIVFPEEEGEVIQATPPAVSVSSPTPSPPLLGRGPLRRGYISFELADAWDLPRPTQRVAGLSEAELQVISWLETYKARIVDVERRRRIDRRAIAAAIAWEALVNVWPFSRRGVGPGKVHTKGGVVQQVEEAGYLPKRSDDARKALLRIPEEAIEYVGAIMAGHADIAQQFGYDIRRNVPVLTNEFNGRDLEQWRQHLSNKKPGSPLEPGNRMALWARDNLAFLELAVGTPDPSVFTSP